MAGAVIRGLLAHDYNAKNIRASAPTRKHLDSLQSDQKIHTSLDNQAITRDADVVVLGVKPQQMKAVCHGIADTLRADCLIISLAAGITCDSIRAWLKQDLAVVRCMSNTPAQIGAGASGLFANRRVSNKQKLTAESILGAVGVACWVEDEKLIDTVTALAGSGPAYFFLFIEAMIAAAVEQGMDHDTAKRLAKQTAFGAAKLARDSNEDIGVLREKVTSPKGTTEQAIISFESSGLRESVKNAMNACAERAQELATLD